MTPKLHLNHSFTVCGRKRCLCVAILLTSAFGFGMGGRALAQSLVRPSSATTLTGAFRDQQSDNPRELSHLSRTSPLGRPSVLEKKPEPDSAENPLFSHGEASQFSGAEDRAAAAFRLDEMGIEAAKKTEPHLFRLGPAFFRVSAGLRVELTDNVDNSSNDAQPDLIVTPAIYMDGHWEISKINDLKLRLGFGYSAYLAHPELNSSTQTLELTPGTEIAFNIKMGNVYVSVSERPQLGQDTANQLTAPSGLLYTTFTNDFDLGVFWDLNDLQIQGGYHRTDTIPLTSQSRSVNRSESSESQSNRREAETTTLDSLNRSVDTASISATLRLGDYTSVGLEGAISKISHRSGSDGDGVSYHAGLFIVHELSRYIDVRLAGGYQMMNFDSADTGEDIAVDQEQDRREQESAGETDGGTGQNRPASRGSTRASAPYFNLEVKHRVNRFVTNSLSVGYEADLGSRTNSIQTTYARDHLTWNITEAVALNVHASFEIGKESGGSSAETLKLVTFGVATNVQLSRRLQMGLYYEFVSRTGGGNDERGDQSRSDELAEGGVGDYISNRLGINLSYEF
jgi:hypothetical protein